MVSTYRALVDVERPAVDLATLAKSPLPSLPEGVLPFIWPSRYCEADRFEAFVESEFGGLDGGSKVAAMAEWIRREMTYAPGSSTGTGTSGPNCASKSSPKPRRVPCPCSASPAPAVPASRR